MQLKKKFWKQPSYSLARFEVKFSGHFSYVLKRFEGVQCTDF
jgi:hypothetical protein